MKNFCWILFHLICLSAYGQDSAKFNLNFEKKTTDKPLPDGWLQWGDYQLGVSEKGYSGNYAAKIVSTESDLNFGSIAYHIPAKYEGKKIKLEGFMKIKNVADGFAGLLLRIDGNGTSLAFDNMQSQGIKGTKDWKKYSIELPYPEEGEQIFVAGILVGQGEAWFDDFVLTIDGEDVQTLKEVKRKRLPAALDKEFIKGSAITSIVINEQNVANLELLGRIWGLMKYHHPKVAKGNYNWDFELFRMLPQYLNITDDRMRDRYLLKWLSKYGGLKTCNDCASTETDALLKPDLAWVHDSSIGKKLQKKLEEIYKNRHQGENYYVEMAVGVGNPKFLHENAYENMPYPDTGFRLLAAFKYWNMIHYYFPYKHLMDKDWNEALKTYIPKFIEAQDELEYELAAVQMIGDIQDTHANLWGGNNKIMEWKGKYYPPIHTRFIENQLVVVDYYNLEHKASVGLNIGAVITKINGTPVEALVKEKAPYYPASNQPTRLRDISRDILRSNDQKVKIEYEQDGKVSTKMLTLYDPKSLNYYAWYRKKEGKCYKLLSDEIGYITLATIQSEDIEAIKNLFAHTKGVVIDIRNYPSTFVPFLLGSYLVSSPTPFVKFTKGNVNNPGEFTYTSPLSIPASGDLYGGKVVVLVNELSQSQAEYTAMAFRAGHNTTIVGSTTAGADGNVSKILLPGGLSTMISGIGVYYPNGAETQRIGIVPDVEVLPTIKGIRNGKDELLEKAIELIEKE
ncbi:MULTISPECIES: S41 family peptidase [unclassified Aureispira]|uniref:S41 family peptidase n=1 Tax=unclassified Aureispira TaxID=2649989 RepID=UPI0006990159|nr:MULTISPECIES: S41 family peptidase [unclassified Aureispira]WMX12852.1 S41 family peptidase [Aureispira sp. CCB-E]